MTQHIEEARKLEPEWRYEIQYGPEGEANYAWIYKGGLFVATMRTHHAVEIVKAIAALAAAEERGRSEERERCAYEQTYAQARKKDQFPQPRRNDGGKPCGECRIQLDETCDICGAVNQSTHQSAIITKEPTP